MIGEGREEKGKKRGRSGRRKWVVDKREMRGNEGVDREKEEQRGAAKVGPGCRLLVKSLTLRPM